MPTDKKQECGCPEEYPCQGAHSAPPKCEHNWGSWAGEKSEHNKCCLCGAYKVTPEARVDWETLARQLHEWYLEATLDLDPLNYNANAQKDYDALSEEQKFIDRFIAKKILAAFEKGREAR